MRQIEPLSTSAAFTPRAKTTAGAGGFSAFYGREEQVCRERARARRDGGSGAEQDGARVHLLTG